MHQLTEILSILSGKNTKCSVLLVLLYISLVSSGANDLHFYDGASTADVIAGDVFFEILDPPELRYSFRIRPAKDFGAPFNESIQFERSKLVPTVPLHSCSDIVNHEEILGHIALSERGECSFVFKTTKAQQAGARAIIITESVDKWDESLDHLIEMVDDKMELDVNIPAAFLLGRSGATILRTLRRLRRNYAVINLPVNMTLPSETLTILEDVMFDGQMKQNSNAGIPRGPTCYVLRAGDGGVTWLSSTRKECIDA